MMVELAPALLALAAMVATLLAGCGVAAVWRDMQAEQLARRLATALFALMSGCFLLLVHAYITSDFSVANVVQNSHTAKPLLYKITGSWGNHEGSMLLWVWILTGFTAAYAWQQRHRAVPVSVPALAVLGFVSLGFIFFILFTSNPFARVIEPEIEGGDLNPLLQDIGLAIHPPLLYLGYVGFAVVFALAVAALLRRQPIDAGWARQMQPWALLAWAFLTAGIGLGSWWAYRELGWGGWWFWDPVENVSLLPWLSGTALIHCLLVMSRRNVLQNWTLLLTISTFTFSLLGTFLVRSGLLTSVHSFASDPARGLYVLGFVVLVTGGSLWLYALRYPRATPPDFEPISREGGVMINNLLLATLCATVFLGIIYPLLMQVMDLPSVSVGAPFYNTVVVPLALPLLLVAGLGPLLSWKRASWAVMRKALWLSLLVALLLAAVFGGVQWAALRALMAQPMAIAAMALGAWMLAATLSYARRLWRMNGRLRSADYGILLAHAGMGVFVMAAAYASAGRLEAEQQLAVGDSLVLGGYEFEMGALERSQIENYESKRATVYVTATDNSESFSLHPESRFYASRGMETAESSIDGGLRRDVYTAVATAANMGNSTTQSEDIILRVYIMPAMWWIWLGFAMVSSGGFLAAIGYFRMQTTTGR